MKKLANRPKDSTKNDFKILLSFTTLRNKRGKMLKRKFHTSRKYVGRRKNANLARRNKKLAVDSTVVEADNNLGQTSVNEMVNEMSKSASARKLEAFGFTAETLMESQSQPSKSEPDCYFFVQLTSMQSLVGNLLCPHCKQSGLKFEILQKSTQGFAVKCHLICPTCEDYKHEQFMCNRLGKSDSTKVSFEINTLATLAFRGMGCGYSATKEWCNTMNMPYDISYNLYSKNHQKIAEASAVTFKDIVVKSREAIAEAYSAVGVVQDEDGVLNIGVSFDGSWQRRGHSSHSGMACVIDLLTGLPIDYEVLSNFCLKCHITDENPPSQADYDEWKRKHSPNCPKNFNGTANAMEVECALRIWKRSVADHKIRYTSMLCDGDSKSFDAICEAKVYGDVKITKEDCVNHISKRMGTALRKLSAEAKSQGSSISGKGKLTNAKILKIQNYYGRAIKDHANDVGLLKRRIFAILFHLSSTDENPKHQHCPTGPNSWCFWQRALAKSIKPGSHNDHETVPTDIGKRMVPIFQRLSEESLLQRCTRRGTQNQNESLHNLIWRLCPKINFAGRKTIETSVLLSLCQFSMGATFKESLCKVLGIIPGEFLKEGTRRKSIKRLSKAEVANSEAARKRRKQLKYKRSSQEQKTKTSEGETYAAGAFNE